ncbi:zeta toxin family protein [Stenotrophomonas maltophilia]|uniref:zeta toxin family protein n=1 Tax=Stenotrophomonas maltophilia TaxID=40324 RepID=UPI003D18ACC8
MLPHSGLDSTTPQEHPKAIVLAGQPGAGKSGVARRQHGLSGRDMPEITHNNPSSPPLLLTNQRR